MSTLTTAPLAPLLPPVSTGIRRSPAHAAQFRDVPDEEQSRLMQSKTEYRELYHRLKDFPLAVSPATGALLYMLARGCRAQNIVEFGVVRHFYSAPGRRTAR